MTEKEAEKWEPTGQTVEGQVYKGIKKYVKPVPAQEEKIKKGEIVYHKVEKRFGKVVQVGPEDYYELELLKQDYERPTIQRVLNDEEEKKEEIAVEGKVHEGPNDASEVIQAAAKPKPEEEKKVSS